MMKKYKIKKKSNDLEGEEQHEKNNNDASPFILWLNVM